MQFMKAQFPCRLKTYFFFPKEMKPSAVAVASKSNPSKMIVQLLQLLSYPSQLFSKYLLLEGSSLCKFMFDTSFLSISSILKVNIHGSSGFLQRICKNKILLLFSSLFYFCLLNVTKILRSNAMLKHLGQNWDLISAGKYYKTIVFILFFVCFFTVQVCLF